jgi:hypothetical protein
MVSKPPLLRNGGSTDLEFPDILPISTDPLAGGPRLNLCHASRFFASFAALAILVPFSARGVDPTPWDQEKVTSRAEAFSTQMDKIYRGIVRKQTGAQIGSGQSASYLRLKDNLRLGRNEARHLERELQDGKSRDDTYAVFARLMSIVRNAREDARRMFLEQSTLDNIAEANETLRQLAPYYDPDLEAELERAKKDFDSRGSDSP